MGKGKALKLAKDLLDSVDKTYFYFGGVMAKIQENGWFEEAGHETFKDFVTVEMGIKYRKVMYFIELYNFLTTAHIPYEKVKGLGWTKLKEIAPVMNEDNVDALVQKALGMNTLQLIDEVKLIKQGEVKADAKETSSNPIKSKVFKLHTDQREIVDEAIDKAKEAIGTEHDAVALEKICLEYLNTPVGGGKAKSSKVEGIPASNIIAILKEKNIEGALELMQEAFPKASISANLE